MGNENKYTKRRIDFHNQRMAFWCSQTKNETRSDAVVVIGVDVCTCTTGCTTIIYKLVVDDGAWLTNSDSIMQTLFEYSQPDCCCCIFPCRVGAMWRVSQLCATQMMHWTSLLMSERITKTNAARASPKFTNQIYIYEHHMCVWCVPYYSCLAKDFIIFVVSSEWWWCWRNTIVNWQRRLRWNHNHWNNQSQNYQLNTFSDGRVVKGEYWTEPPMAYVS